MSTKFDFHIHTKYLGCANETMEVDAIAREWERVGCEVIGIADHLNSPDKLELHRLILEDIRKLDTDIPVYFGAELNFTGQGQGFVFSEEIKADCGFQFGIGGVHDTYLDEWNLARAIEIQHRHHLLVCQDPVVDVLVHPWWWKPFEFRTKGFGDFPSAAAVPERLTRELAQAAKGTATAIEINAGANLLRLPPGHAEAYFEYLSILNAEGVTFALGSDAHKIEQVDDSLAVWEMVERLSIPENRIWRPAGKPIIGG